ncbi:MAG: glycosyltransferase [Pirellulales bacterium]
MERTLGSLRQAGFDQTIYIGAEPGSVAAKWKAPGVQVRRHQRRLGCYPNWLFVARWLLAETDAPYLLICEDDVEFCDGAAAGVWHGLKTLGDVGYVSLYTPVRNVELAGVQANPGWHALNLGDSSWGALTYAFPREVLAKIVAYVAEPPADGTDQHVSAQVARLNRNAWFHIPSLAQHVGRTSSLGHPDKPGFAAIGYEPDWPGFRQAGGPLHVGFLTPNLLMGGVEYWLHALARQSDSKRIRWRVGLAQPSNQEPSVVREISQHAGVAIGRAGIDKICRWADVIVAWGMQQIPELVHGFRGPVVLVAHGYGPWTESWIKAAAWSATHFAAVSHAAATAFGVLPPPVPYHVIHNGADQERCRPRRKRNDVRAEWGLNKHEVALGFVGRLSPEKNPEAVALAARNLGSPFRAVFIGREYSAGLVAKLKGICPSAMFIPAVHHVGDAFAGIDVLIMASPTEGGPLVVPEAFLAGVPVVATPVGLVQEMFCRWGELAALVPICPTDVQLATAIRRALSPEWKRVVAKARRVAQKHFTAQRMADDWTTYLETIHHEQIHR